MIRLLTFFCCFSLLFSCNDDLVTSTELQDTPIIYGLLNASDTAQYVRVERAFLEEGTDATVLSRDPNQVYYDESVTVSLVKVSRLSEERFALERVNGEEEGYVRNEGPFVTEPNVLYKLSADVHVIDEANEYRIEVDRPGEPLVSSTTPIVGDALLGSPRPVLDNRTMTINPATEFTISLRQDAANAVIYDYAIIVRLQESSTVSTEEKILIWNVARNLSSTRTEEILGSGFYSMLNANLEADVNISRRISELTVRVTGASQAFADYQNVLRANSGITGAEDFPLFSNIDGGQGVFASRNTLLEGGFLPSSITIDSLKTNALTADLRFSF